MESTRRLYPSSSRCHKNSQGRGNLTLSIFPNCQCVVVIVVIHSPSLDFVLVQHFASVFAHENSSWNGLCCSHTVALTIRTVEHLKETALSSSDQFHPFPTNRLKERRANRNSVSVVLTPQKAERARLTSKDTCTPRWTTRLRHGCSRSEHKHSLWHSKIGAPLDFSSRTPSDE